MMLWPLWHWGLTHDIYTYAIATAFIVILPLLSVFALRIMGKGACAAWCAGLLSLGVSQCLRFIM